MCSYLSQWKHDWGRKTGTCILIEPDYVSVRISLQVALMHIVYILTQTALIEYDIRFDAHEYPKQSIHTKHTDVWRYIFSNTAGLVIISNHFGNTASGQSFGSALWEVSFSLLHPQLLKTKARFETDSPRAFCPGISVVDRKQIKSSALYGTVGIWIRFFVPLQHSLHKLSSTS